MNTIKGSSASEIKMIKAIQQAIHAKADGLIGTQTMTDVAVAVGAKCWPLTMTIYNMPVIICEDIIVCNPGSGTGSFKNSISGSFSYNKQPCSIAVNNGKVLCATACHAHINKPESVLYRLEDGQFGLKRCTSASQLPASTKWAVGGMGLLGNFQPVAEGFSGAYSDVLRKTAHTVLGVKSNMVYLIYCRNMNSAEVNKFCRDKLHLDKAIMLDGGHVASVNGEEASAKINTSQVQYYLIQGVSK